MDNPYLATYLNDHLAGSEAALELLRHLEKEHAARPIGNFAQDLRGKIEADRRTLEDLMARLGVAQSRPRKLAAWMAEKLSDLKLRLDDPAHGGLRLLEIFEALSLGIEGKRSLWQALEAASDVNPALLTTDYARLQQEAEEQRQSVETHRLLAAKEAFAAAPIAEKG